ncbi:hypothetical protein [Amycolatopsis lexingtonensis]|uniref:hypothetical protein n=1 Tax=Amycolatopsis lexingtonensis TaxID=218822 RepID=UPI003F7115F4
MSDVEYYRGMGGNGNRAFYRIEKGKPTKYLRASEYGRVTHPVRTSDEKIRARHERVPTGLVPLWARDGERGKERQELLREMRDARARQKAELFVEAYRRRYPEVTWRTTGYFVQAAKAPSEAELHRQAEALGLRIGAGDVVECPDPSKWGKTPEQREAQRALQRATRAVTWGWLMGSGSPTGRFQVNHPELTKAARRYLDLPVEGDMVAGKGPLTGDWFVGRYIGPAKTWRNESEVELREGQRIGLLTSTLKVVEKRA